MERRNSGYSWIAVFVILLVTVGCSVGIAVVIHLLTLSHVGDIKAFPMENVVYAETVDDKIVAYNGNILNCFSSKGKSVWKNALTIGTGYTMNVTPYGVSAWKGGSFSVWSTNSGSSLYSSSVDGDVLSVRADSRFITVMYGNADNSVARIMDTSGRVYDEIAFESQVVLDYGFFSDGSMLWVLSVDTSGTVPTCTMTTYRPSRKAMSGSIGESEQVVYHVQFEKNSICLVGEDYIKQYDYTGAEYQNLRTLVYGWFLMDMSDSGENPLMAFVPNAQVKNGAAINDVRMINNNSDVIVRMPFTCKNLIVKGSRVYGFADDYVMTADVGNKAAVAYALPVRADSVAGVTDDHVGVVFSNGAYYLITLP